MSEEMGVLVLVGRLLLALVFLVAGLGKLADLDGSRDAAAGFGLPQRLAAPVGTLLPLVELAVAVGLVPVDSAPYAAIAGGLLLLAFSGGIANALAHGREPECHCFGQIHSEPAGPRTLIRNLVLLAIAAVVAIGGLQTRGPSATHWIARLPAAAAVGIPAGLLLLAVLGFTVWFALQLLAQNGRIAERLDVMERALAALAGGGAPAGFEDHVPLGAGLGELGLPIGAPAPAFTLPDPSGTEVSLEQLLVPGTPALLVFSDAGCGPCTALMPSLARWQAEHREQVTVAVLAAGDREANVAKAREHGLDPLLLEPAGRAVAERYGASGTPMAVVVSASGTIMSPTVGGADAIGTLLARVVARPPGLPAPSAPAPSLPVHHVGPAPAVPPPAGPGDPAPDVRLTDLTGAPASLGEVLADRTLALFWNPDCGFCQRMLPALHELEARDDRPGIVVLATGDADRTRAQRLRSPVLHDPQALAQSAFGADGTPMAVLIERGRIASPVAIGADAVLALAAGGAGSAAA